MIIDKDLELCSATALTLASTSLVLASNVIDTGTVVRNLGVGKPLWCVIQVQTTVLASGGACNVTFKLASDAQAAIAVDGSATVHGQTQAIPKGTLIAGYTTFIALPPAMPAYEEYLGLLNIADTNNVTAGKINAWITDDIQAWIATADALSAP